MIKLINGGVYYTQGGLVKENVAFMVEKKKQAAIKGTLSYGVLNAHNKGGEDNLKLKFDGLVSHDITYVGIIQTAKASGMKEFSVPYTLTNCHNSLCAVGGTINADDHAFGLSAAQKYGGNFVPPNLAVIHRYMREQEAKCGAMILGSDSHTRYGALGAMGVGEGGGELVKQLLNQTYDITKPAVIAVYMRGKPKKGVGPHDIALALIGATFKKGFLKNKVLEFVGPGIKNLSMDYRCAIDVMTTETACLTSIWETDEITEEFYKIHGRHSDFKIMKPADPAYYDGAVIIDLSRIDPMISLPFHPSNAYTIKEFLKNANDILAETEKIGNEICGGGFVLRNKLKNGRLYVDQGVIAGCAGGNYESIAEAAEILKNGKSGTELALSVYPESQPVFKSLTDNGYISSLISSGAIIKPSFCGPCFGAGDTPFNNGLSIRHTTRNFENREGSKPSEGQLAAVALMDARSIAATAANGGALTPATEIEYVKKIKKYFFDKNIYENKVYRGEGNPNSGKELVYGKNITDWEEQIPLAENILIKAASVLSDEVTTTDELIPSGETSSYRSNPLRLAEYTLSRKDIGYVERAKAIKHGEETRRSTGELPEEVLRSVGIELKPDTMYASFIAGKKMGDGSAREQAAACQRMLGGLANIVNEYATKRYRSNLINWGMLPFVCRKFDFSVGDYVYIENMRELIKAECTAIPAKHISGGKIKNIMLELGELTQEEKNIILAGCLINYNKNK
ncbi:MAG: hydratase [Clostridia bacterium]|nr:hydratase [Clostridia bacterium]